MNKQDEQELIAKLKAMPKGRWFIVNHANAQTEREASGVLYEMSKGNTYHEGFLFGGDETLKRFIWYRPEQKPDEVVVRY